MNNKIDKDLFDSDEYKVPNPLEPDLIRFLADENYLPKLIKEVNSEWIYKKSNKIIYEIITDFFKSNSKIPNQKYISEEAKDKCNGNNELTDEIITIYKSCLNGKNDDDILNATILNRCITSVHDHWTSNTLNIGINKSITLLGQNNNSQALIRIEEAVSAIRQNGQNRTVIEYDVSEFAPIALDRYSTAFNDEEIITTGITELDAKMGGGFRKPNLVGLGCGTQGGKSIVSMNLGYNAFNQGLSVAYVSLEMSEEEFLARLHSRMSGVSATHILMRTMDEGEKLKLRKAVLLESVNTEKRKYAEKLIKSFGKKLANFTEDDFNTNFYNDSKISLRENTYYPIDIPANCSVEVLRSKILNLQQNRNCDMLIIDYPGIMEEIAANDQNWGTYSSLYTRLKALARELDVVLIAPIQAYNDGEYKYAKSIRDHIDIGLNWKRTEQDLKDSKVRFWFTKLRHSKIEIFEGNKDDAAKKDLESSDNDPTDRDLDYSMRDPIMATFNTDIMLLDDPPKKTDMSTNVGKRGASKNTSKKDENKEK